MPDEKTYKTGTENCVMPEMPLCQYCDYGYTYFDDEEYGNTGLPKFFKTVCLRGIK